MTVIIDYLSHHWVLLTGGAVLGFCVGLFTGLFGAGGGFIVTPALNIFLGLNMAIAVGTSACQVMGASAFSLYHRLDRRLMGIRVALTIGIGIPLGAFFGSYAVKFMGNLAVWRWQGRTIDPVNLILMSIFAVFLLTIGLWLVYDNYVLRRNRSDDDQDHVGFLAHLLIRPLVQFRTIPSGKSSVPILVILGIFVGFLSGLLGIGGGVIMMPMLFYLVGQETKWATQTSTILVFLSGAFSTVFHAMDKNIDYTLALILVFGAFFGTKVGIAIHDKVSGKSIRQYFSFVILAAWILVMYKLSRIIFY